MCRKVDPIDAVTKERPSNAPETHNYTVVYDSESHWSVLTQRAGSVWPRVLPYCAANVLLMLALRILKDYGGVPGEALTRMYALGKIGFHYIKFVVAFLIVTRVKMSIDRYNEARTNIGRLYREARELVQNTVVFTEWQRDLAAKEWRLEMAYRTLLLLRTSMAVLNFTVREEAAWMIPELSGKEKDIVYSNLLINPKNRHYAIDENTEFEESMRVPVLVAYMLTETIHEQSARLEDKLPLQRENKLYSSVDSFMQGYYGLRKFTNTPVPFPLIQMTRTFLFLYVFAIPFELLLTDDSGIVAHCFFVFMISLGFIGLETVAIELDNPFGEDPNDFNNLGLAATANEDTYLTILDIDGPKWADKLRHRMRNHKKDEPAFPKGFCVLQNDVSAEDTPLLR